MRIGVGKPPQQGARRRPRADRSSPSASASCSTSVVVEAADAVETIVADGIDAAMRKFNGQR